MNYGFVLSKGTTAQVLRLAIEAEDASWAVRQTGNPFLIAFTWDHRRHNRPNSSVAANLRVRPDKAMTKHRRYTWLT